MVSSAHEAREEVYVILRADLFHGAEVPLDVLINVKGVVRSEETARSEVQRLNAMHADGQVRYWYAASKFFQPNARQT